jgi:hypothetical protein
MPGPQNEIVSFDGSRRGHRFRIAELDLQTARNHAGDFVLHAEHILQLAREGLAPDMKPIGCFNQLRRDANFVARFAHAPLHHIGHAQLSPDLGHREVLALERKGRGARRDFQVRHPTQHVEELLADAIGEVLVGFVVGEIREREDGDGFWVRVEGENGGSRRLGR